jgi:CheY-like chemotaxis protein
MARDPQQFYAQRLAECHRLSAETDDPVEQAAYEAMAREFENKLNDPAPAVDAPADNTGADNTAAGDVQPAQSARPRLLVIDDQPDIVRVIGHLAETLGYAVRGVSDSTKAFETFTEFAPDAVILDLVMPGVDGIEILHKIRESGRAPRVLVMSGYGEFYLQMVDTLASGSGMPNVSTASKPVRRDDLVRFLGPQQSS